MTDRYLKILENGRYVSRGLYKDRRGVPTLEKDPDETLKMTLDWAGFLGTDTISSQTTSTDGPGLSASNTTTTSLLTISGQEGDITVTITTAAGLIKEQIIGVFDPRYTQLSHRYPS